MSCYRINKSCKKEMSIGMRTMGCVLVICLLAGSGCHSAEKLAERNRSYSSVHHYYLRRHGNGHAGRGFGQAMTNFSLSLVWTSLLHHH
jgi:hypothetical protein